MDKMKANFAKESNQLPEQLMISPQNVSVITLRTSKQIQGFKEAQEDEDKDNEDTYSDKSGGSSEPSQATLETATDDSSLQRPGSLSPFSNRTYTLYHAHHVTGDDKRHRNQRRTKGVTRLVEGGAASMAAEVMAVMPEEGVTILEAVVKRGGLVVMAAAYAGIKRLGAVLKEGAATLVTMCRKGGSEVVAELAAVPKVERIIWELMAMATLLRILRRRAAGLDGGINFERIGIGFMI
ncbi:hypothetical protein V8G54_037424 [Vigna mungo]|uniref:Uncharacterized protein n=1 Tax=Vigna mungo TaxID=3915 RepID=A0AAQ3MJ81_VIGMU